MATTRAASKKPEDPAQESKETDTTTSAMEAMMEQFLNGTINLIKVLYSALSELLRHLTNTSCNSNR